MLNSFLRLTDKRKSVSLVPLIDIVFILLLFFLLTTTVVKDKQLTMDHRLSNSDFQAQVIEIFLETERGVFVYDDARIDSSDRGELSQWVQQIGIRSNFVVDAGPDISTQALITFLDRLNDVGVQKLTIDLDRSE